MADLKSLIRVRKHSVEQKQKFVADLYRQAEELEGQKQELEETLVQERYSLDDLGIEALSYFGHYSEAVRERIEDIEVAGQKLNARIEVAQEDMRMAYAELKKVEITQERREDKATKEEKRKEDQMFDDIAIEGFRRKGDG